MCSWCIYVHELHQKYVPYSVSCSPDAALRLVKEFELIAMMEFQCDERTGYSYDYDKCTLMTAMSVLAIADYLVEHCQWKRADIDIAIPFIQGCFQSVELYVMRLKGDGSPEIHCVTGTTYWGSTNNNSGKIDVLSKLAVILARIVKIALAHEGIAVYFRRYHTMVTNNVLDLFPPRSSQKSSTTASTSKSTTGNGGNRSAANNNPNLSPSDNETAAKIAASASGLIHDLDYPLVRNDYHGVMFGNDIVQNQRNIQFNFYQQESPFYFKGTYRTNNPSDHKKKNTLVFCKVWRNGDRYTHRNNIDDEIRFYKRVNANHVPSPMVIDSLTA